MIVKHYDTEKFRVGRFYSAELYDDAGTPLRRPGTPRPTEPSTYIANGFSLEQLDANLALVVQMAQADGHA